MKDDNTKKKLAPRKSKKIDFCQHPKRHVLVELERAKGENGNLRILGCKNCPYQTFKYDDPPRRIITCRGGSARPCFLTTACIEIMGLPDDCAELTTLREFRDTYITNLPHGEDEILEYYKVAPRIIEAISLRKDAPIEFRRLYQELITPSVKLISEGELQEAYQLYRGELLRLKSLFIPDE